MTTTGYLLTILPKFTSLMSILGASMIISQVLMSKKNRENMQQRLVCAMSGIDLMVSIVWFTTNLFIPPDAGFVWPLGNSTTCTIQGFIVQSSISSVLYNASLSLYYLVVIKFEWKDRQTQKLEKWMHMIPILFGTVTASITLALDIYNPADWDCWIGPTPEGERTKLANTLKWAFFFGPLWASIVFASANMARIYRHVKQREMSSSGYRAPGSDQLKQTKAVAWQGSLYVGAFLVTWLFPTIARLIQLCGGTVPQSLVVLAGTFIPFQGFFNAVVYFRLRFIKCSRDFEDRSKVWVVMRIMNLTLCPCCIKNRYNTVDGKDLENQNEQAENNEDGSDDGDSQVRANAMSQKSQALKNALEATGFSARNMPPTPGGDDRPQRRASRRVSLWRIMKKGGVKATGSKSDINTSDKELQIRQSSSYKDLVSAERSGDALLAIVNHCCDHDDDGTYRAKEVESQPTGTQATESIQTSEKNVLRQGGSEEAKVEETSDILSDPNERRSSITWSENVNTSE